MEKFTIPATLENSCVPLTMSTAPPEATSPIFSIQREKPLKKSRKGNKCISKHEEVPWVKVWISRDPQDNERVVCRYCESHILAQRSYLVDHSRTLKHIRNLVDKSSPEVRTQHLEMLAKQVEATASLPKKKKINEIIDIVTGALKPYRTVINAPNNSELGSIKATQKNASQSSSKSVSTLSSSFMNIDSGSNDEKLECMDDVPRSGYEELWMGGNGSIPITKVNVTDPTNLVEVKIKEDQQPPIAKCLTTGDYHYRISHVQTTETPGFGMIPLNYNVSRLKKFNANDVIKAVQGGRFNIGELCSVAKVVATQMDSLISANDLGGITHRTVNQNIGQRSGAVTLQQMNALKVNPKQKISRKKSKPPAKTAFFVPKGLEISAARQSKISKPMTGKEKEPYKTVTESN